jgi:ABC-type uncharacterized transport system involved in gliding motility auxiliary subunit
MGSLKTIVGGLSLACLAGAGILWAIYGKLTAINAIPLLVGLVLLLVFLYWNFTGFRDFLAKRSTRYGFNVTILILVTLGIITLVEAISAKYYTRWDFTMGRRYSLSKQSKQFLDKVSAPVKVLAFYRLDQEGRAELEELLKQYKSYSPQFDFEIVDPDLQRQTAQRYQVSAYGTIVVESGETRETIFESNEQAITNAVLRASRPKKKTVYFLAGHGEHSIKDEQRAGLSLAKQAIENANYGAKELVLIEQKEVPKDASVLVISGPKKDFLPEAAAAIRNYIEDGGKVLFQLEPFTVPKLAKELAAYGILLRDDIVVDRMSRLFGGDYFIPVVTNYKDHDITRDFRLASFFPTARSVFSKTALEKGIEAQELALASPDSWGETNQKLLQKGEAAYDEKEDAKGPIPLAAITTVRPKDPDKKVHARLVVFGDSDFSSNAYLGMSGNSDLFLNTIRWLAEQEELISVRPRQRAFTPVILAGTFGTLAFWLPIVVLPGAVIAIGAVILVRRRRRG